MTARQLARAVGMRPLNLLAATLLGIVTATSLAVPAQAAPAPTYLDLPATNWDGRLGGGLNPQLPTDPGALRTALDADRGSLIQDHPGQAGPLLHTPLSTLVAQQRIWTRLPEFTAELARHVRVARSTR